MARDDTTVHYVAWRATIRKELVQFWPLSEIHASVRFGSAASVRFLVPSCSLFARVAEQLHPDHERLLRVSANYKTMSEQKKKTNKQTNTYNMMCRQVLAAAASHVDDERSQAGKATARNASPRIPWQKLLSSP